MKASKREACQLPPQAESFSTDVRSTISNAEEATQGSVSQSIFYMVDFCISIRNLLMNFAVESKIHLSILAVSNVFSSPLGAFNCM